MRGGASLGKPLEIPGGFEVAPVIGVSGVVPYARSAQGCKVSSLSYIKNFTLLIPCQKHSDDLCCLGQLM